jgi:chorismate mutase
MDIFREKIDSVDEKIFDLLLERYLIVEDIGKYKKNNKLDILDSKRENKIYEKIEDFYLLDQHIKYLKNIYKTVMNESKRIQKI